MALPVWIRTSQLTPLIPELLVWTVTTPLERSALTPEVRVTEPPSNQEEVKEEVRWVESEEIRRG